MFIIPQLEKNLDKLKELLNELFPALSHSSMAESTPESVIQQILYLNTELQQQVAIFIRRVYAQRRLIDLTKQIQTNTIRINGFINEARALEEAIYNSISMQPKIRGGVSTSELYATSVTIAFQSNTVPMINSELFDVSQDIEAMTDEMKKQKAIEEQQVLLEVEANRLLEALKQAAPEVSLKTLLRQGETAAKMTFPPVGAYSDIPIPFSPPVHPDPTSTSLASSSPSSVINMIMNKSPDLGYPTE